jgi:hypothetical protein
MGLETERRFDNSRVLLQAVCNFLKELSRHCAGPDKPLTLHIHQFGHTALYTPVYMAFESILSYCDEQAAKQQTPQWLRVQYSSHEPDSAVEESLLENEPWGSENDPVVHLGLSEVTARRAGPVRNLIEKPIVKRLPLWGVALADNPRINRLKSRRGTSGRNAGFEEFRRLFAGKMSLVQPQNGDLRPGEDGEQISVSIYEAGSTAYQFFCQYLLSNEQDVQHLKLIPIRKGFEDEFDPLLGRQVDVALTVQPWRAMTLAGAYHGSIEVVYTHLGRPEPVTSLYVRRDPTDRVDLWKSFLMVMGALVQEHVGTVYDCGIDSLAFAYHHYIRAAQRQIEYAAGDANFRLDRLESEEVFQYAVQLLADSRVYYYDLPIDAADLTKRHESLAMGLNSRLYRYFSDVGKRDPVYRCSIAASLVRRVRDWHMDTTLAVLKCRESERIFKEVAQTFDVEFFPNRTLMEIRNEWCVRRPDLALTQIYRQCDLRERPPEEPWRVHVTEEGERVHSELSERHIQVDFTPWIHRNVLQHGLLHLNAQFTPFNSETDRQRQLELRRLRADVLVLGRTRQDGIAEGYEGLSWLWIEYHRAQSEVVRWNKFFDANPFGNGFLNLWYVNVHQPECVRRVFFREDHGTFTLANGIPELTIQTPVERILHPTNNEKMRAPEGLLFTFRVAGIENRAIPGLTE